MVRQPTMLPRLFVFYRDAPWWFAILFFFPFGRWAGCDELGQGALGGLRLSRKLGVCGGDGGSQASA